MQLQQRVRGLTVQSSGRKSRYAGLRRLLEALCIKRERTMQDEHVPEPDNTAVRTALWRALHVQADALPHVFEDEVG